jgi:FAD/FMN-containing dehydrogenase
MSVNLEQLSQLLGPQGMLLGEDVKARPNFAWGMGSCPARAIIRPNTTEALADAMAICHDAHQSMVPWGGLTGLVNGMTCTDTDVAISLERLTGIESFDADAGIMAVKAGTPLQTVQEAAREQGWLFPVDLGARGSATIGGMIATNAGGNSVIRYGMMRNQILGIEAVLPDGRIIDAMNEMLKNNTGFDLKQLLIGSEGTLGIVTKAVLKLQPAPCSSHTAMVVCDNFESVKRLLKNASTQLANSLTAFEAMWGSYYDLNVAETGRHQAVLPPHRAFYILLESSHSELTETNPLERFLEEQFDLDVISDAVIANSVQQADQLWAIRDDVEAKIIVHKPTIGYDISLPLRHMQAYTEQLERALTEFDPKINCVTFGHLGDGNIHLGIGPAPDKKAIDDIVYNLLTPFKGSVSAEHGIGLDKKAYLSLCRTDTEIQIMKSIKAAIDPRGLMNPGKVF